MNIKERRENERQDMKNKIMKATMNIIEQEGYEQLSIRKIAAKIQYSPTTIYIYYKDKAKIINDMAEELYAKVIAQVSISLKKSEDLSTLQRVKDSMEVVIKSLCNEPEMVKAIMFSGQNVIFANDCLDGKPSNKGIEMLDLLILDGIENNTFRKHIKNNSWIIISALFGFVSCVIVNGIYLREDFQVHVDSFVDIIIGGMLSVESK